MEERKKGEKEGVKRKEEKREQDDDAVIVWRAMTYIQMGG